MIEGDCHDKQHKSSRPQLTRQKLTELKVISATPW